MNNLQNPPAKIKLELTQQQAIQLFGVLDNADEFGYTNSLRDIYDRLGQVATNHYLSQEKP
jgi:hypothetical protein